MDLKCTDTSGSFILIAFEILNETSFCRYEHGEREKYDLQQRSPDWAAGVPQNIVFKQIAAHDTSLTQLLYSPITHQHYSLVWFQLIVCSVVMLFTLTI